MYDKLRPVAAYLFPEQIQDFMYTDDEWKQYKGILETLAKSDPDVTNPNHLGWIHKLMAVQLLRPGGIRELSFFPKIYAMALQAFHEAVASENWSHVVNHACSLYILSSGGITITSEGLRMIPSDTTLSPASHTPVPPPQDFV